MSLPIAPLAAASLARSGAALKQLPLPPLAASTPARSGAALKIADAGRVRAGAALRRQG
jgi:hypothetical protein